MRKSDNLWKACFPGSLFDMGADAAQIGVLMRVVYRAGDSGECFESVPNIAKAVRKRRKFVEEALKFWIDAGVLTCLKRPGKSAIYKVKPIPMEVSRPRSQTTIVDPDPSRSGPDTLVDPDRTPWSIRTDDLNPLKLIPSTSKKASSPCKEPRRKKPSKKNLNEPVFDEEHSPAFRKAMTEWFEYKIQLDGFRFTPIGWKKLLTQQSSKNTVQLQADIDHSMSSGWKGIHSKPKQTNNKAADFLG